MPKEEKGGDFCVATRKGSAQWADSVLPLSPRSAAKIEAGHLTSRERRPSLSAKTAPGLVPPPNVVVSSDNMTCEDRGWQSQRELHAEELSLDRRNHVRPQRGLSPAAQQRKEEAQAVREYYAYQERVKQYHREQG